MKLGRKPARHTAHTIQSAYLLDRALAPLGAPPMISFDYGAAVDKATCGNWGMLGNDNYSDCCEADDGHQLMMRTANVGTILIPTTEQVLKLYTAETGFNPDVPSSDQGTDETADCEWMCAQGFLGHKAEATTGVNPTSLTNLQWCVQLFGACKFGVNLPQSAMDQFNAGKPWTVVERDGGIIGGHDIPGISYSAATKMFDVITWGQRIQASFDWVLEYTEEAHALLFPDFIRASGNSPAGFSLEMLLRGLSAIAFPSPPRGSTHRHHRRRMRRLRRQRQNNNE
jgi:hypothetical protein